MVKNLKSLKNTNAFKRWLNQIIMRFYYDTIRKKIRRPQFLSVEKDDIEEKTFVDKNKKPDEHSLYKELDDVITQAVKQLPEQLKIATILREFQGLSYEEIASVTGSSIGTVKSRISRARIKLQESLREYIK